MFEDNFDGEGVPCDHPLKWFHRVAHWAHARIESLTFFDRQKWHDRQPDWVCEAYDRIEFSFPCRQCDEDRSREYGALIKSDEDVIARWPQSVRPIDYAGPDDYGPDEA